MKNYQFTSIFLILVFLFSLSTKESHAKWKDNSGDLPGMMSDGEIIAIAVGGAVLITGVIIWAKKKKAKEAETSVNELKSKPLSLTGNNKPKSFYEELQKASEQSPVQLFANCNSLDNNNFCNKQVMSVGVRIKF